MKKTHRHPKATRSCLSRRGTFTFGNAAGSSPEFLSKVRECCFPTIVEQLARSVEQHGKKFIIVVRVNSSSQWIIQSEMAKMKISYTYSSHHRELTLAVLPTDDAMIGNKVGTAHYSLFDASTFTILETTWRAKTLGDLLV